MERVLADRNVSELVVLPAGHPTAPRAEWLSTVRRAKALSWLSLVWMGLEGGIAITAGILAGSIALVGFGIDSAIEGVASAVIIWRFTGARVLSHAAEERAQKLVAIQFFLLAPYVTFEAIRALANSEHPEVSPLGMALTASSVIGMREGVETWRGEGCCAAPALTPAAQACGDPECAHAETETALKNA
jgi:hypothetical protein